jgi:hypothetical protein
MGCRGVRCRCRGGGCYGSGSRFKLTVDFPIFGVDALPAHESREDHGTGSEDGDKRFHFFFIVMVNNVVSLVNWKPRDQAQPLQRPGLVRLKSLIRMLLARNIGAYTDDESHLVGFAVQAGCNDSDGIGTRVKAIVSSRWLNFCRKLKISIRYRIRLVEESTQIA